MADMEQALKSAGIVLTSDAVDRLNRYHDLLLDWNTRMDLTSVSQQDMARRHFVDSLLPLSQTAFFPSGVRLIDVGTGAGFPGLALAAAREDISVTLLEAQGKRCQFLRAVIDALQLKNALVIQERAEVLGHSEEHREAYDLATARAVAPLNVLCEYLLAFVKIGGHALCWKGPAAAEELPDGAFAAEALGGRLEETKEMFEGENRHVLAPVLKTEKTLPQYPRKNGIPVKRPLRLGKK